jgi:hypothetical protein
MNRRTLLQRAAALTSASALGRAIRAETAPARERLRAGFVGVGGRAYSLLEMFSAQPDVEVAALADVDPERIAMAL